MGREESSRDFLRQLVRTAATRASTAEEFIALVRQNGVRIQPRWSEAGQLVGYRVAVPIDYSESSADGLVWFGGARLARDLSAPRLTERWASAPAPWPPVPRDERDRGATVGRAERRDAVKNATQVAIEARAELHTLTIDSDNGRHDGEPALGGGPDNTDVAEGVANATLDMLVVTARVVEGYEPGPLTFAAMAYERAALTPHRAQPSTWAPIAVELRTAARRLARAAAVSRAGHSGVAVSALILALTALVAEIAAWREQAGDHAQAVAARSAASQLRQDSAAHATSAHPDQPVYSPLTGSPRLSGLGPSPSRSRTSSPRAFRPPEPPEASQLGRAR